MTQPRLTNADIEVKNIQKVSSGYLIWSKNRAHRLPTFAPFSAVKGINIYQASKLALKFYRSAEGRLIVRDLKVLATK